MKFIWDDINLAEVAAHEIAPTTAESVFYAEDFHHADGIRITTAFPLSGKRRRT